jgi:hypothetical protein
MNLSCLLNTIGYCSHQTDVCVKKVVIRVFSMQPFLISVLFLTKFIFFQQKWDLFFLL